MNDTQKQNPTTADRFFDLCPDLICTASLDGFFTRLTPHWEEATGYTTEELMAVPFLEFVHPDDQDSTLSEVSKIQTGGSAIGFINRYVCKNGEVLWLQWMARASIDDEQIYAIARDISREVTVRQQANQSNRLLEAITLAQAQCIADTPLREVFDHMLANLLDITGSEYGFIGEVLHDDDGTPYLKTHAITNIAWDDATRSFYEEHAPNGLEFRNLDTLFGRVISTGKPVIANDPQSDPRAGGLPHGHPSLDHFLGLPFYNGPEMIGNVGIANRKGGYEEELVTFLAPFLATCANIIEAGRAERKRIKAEVAVRDSESRHRAIFDSVVDGIISIDDRGIVHSFNPAAEQMFGYGSSEIVGQNISLLMGDDDAAKHDQYLDNYTHGKPKGLVGAVRKMLGKRRDGSLFPIELSVSESQLEQGRLFTGLIRDQTIRSNVDKMKNEFVSTVSHELRTPLTSIRGSLGLLSSPAFQDLPEKAEELIQIALDNSERLNRLIDDILDIEKIESGEMDFNMRPLSLSAIVEQTIEANRGYADLFGIDLVNGSSPGSSRVMADPDRLLQVLANLISNAIKFSSKGSKVIVRSIDRGPYQRIEVQDFGRGISENFRDRVFTRFAQEDSSDTRRKGGTGLGLNITQKIIRRLGGKLDFESTLGEGSSFFFELPSIDRREQLKTGTD